MGNILVTGGAGFIGSHVCEALLERGDQVICLDSFNDYYNPAQKRRNIEALRRHSGFRLVEGDVTRGADVEEAFRDGVSAVVHLAARAGVRPSVADPLLYEETNVRGTLLLLEQCRKEGTGEFVFGSSSSVYGRTSRIPFSEEDASDRVISPYAATKRAGELLCHTYSYLHGLKTTCLRFFTVYGPRGRPDMAPYLFTQKIGSGEPITMFGDGTSRRDYTYVQDIVSGVLASLGRRGSQFEILNLGESQTVELRRLIQVIEAELGKRAVIVQKEMPREDVPLTYADISKARDLLDYNPRTGIEEGIRAFVAWYRSPDRVR